MGYSQIIQPVKKGLAMRVESGLPLEDTSSQEMGSDAVEATPTSMAEISPDSLDEALDEKYAGEELEEVKFK